MLRLLLGICFAISLATCQYTSVGNFSCDEEPEIVSRTASIGSVYSPCYYDPGANYPDELNAGLKLVNITHDDAKVVGYQLTIRDFQIADSDRLYIGETTEDSTGDNLRAVRNVTLQSMSSSEGKVFVTDEASQNITTLDFNGTYLLDGFTTLILDFYTVIDTKEGRGFLIEYEADIDQCMLTGTDSYCKNTGSCTKTGFNTVECNCTGTGYAGSTCEEDINECNGNPCNGTGDCVNRDGSYNCTCLPGYEGGVDGPCTDIDECAVGQSNDCVANATCDNTDGSHNCTCDNGYSGDGKVNCTDIDECTVGSDNCDIDQEATCTNTDGSFTCACKAGYEGDGEICNDINECDTAANNCDVNAVCSNIDGSFNCACKSGYTGNGTSCEDIDECAVGQSNDCVANATCDNTDGSHNCTCDPGYSGDGKVNCTDIDECTVGSDNCDIDQEATCTNTDGSFTCACKAGYEGDGEICNDINECMDGSNNCHSDAVCSNVNGSFTCACKDGFSGNGTNCEDIDECADDALHNCKDGETTCDNLPGSFQCICNFPTFRGTPGNCDYYCDHNSTCLANRNGYIDVPVNWTGDTLYATFDETFFNFSEPTNGTGIRFTFIQFNTELMDDFLLFYPGNVRDLNLEIVALSGTKDRLYNVKQRIVGTQNIEANGSSVTALMDQSQTDPVLTLSSGFINLAFTSDRLNASTGFVIKFEYDPNDCENAACVNAYGCVDKTFAYECNCTDGYEGLNCDLDINECNHTTIANPCDKNATCSNTDGGYNCTCNEFYTGTGTACQPHLVLSDYAVTEDVNALSINFGITSAWRSTEYIAYFVVTISWGANTVIYNVTLSDLAGGGFNVEGLSAYTAYNVTVGLVGGPLFNTAVFENHLGTRTFTTKEGPAGTPKNLNVAIGTRDRVEITWEKPDEIGFGAVTSYQLCYQPAGDEKTQNVVKLREVSTEPTCIILDDTYTTYTWVGLPSYLNLVFHIRANTSAGAGNYTATVSSYTGSTCVPWTEFENRLPCPDHQSLLESEGFPQNTEIPLDSVLMQEWSYNLASLTNYTGWRPTFVYFSTVPSESALDFGYGDIDITDHDIEKANRVKSYSGPTPNAEEGFNFTGNSILWFAFISDRVRKQSGFQVEIEVDRNNCDSAPCLNDGTCADELYDYTCTCTPEWTGKSCETPRVQPVVMCAPGKRDLEINFTIPADRGNDETIIGGYTIDLTPAGTVTNTMMKSIEMTREASFSGLDPYKNYTITVTVHASDRNAMLVAGSVVCETLQDAPTAPRNVVATPGNRSLDVTWEAPMSPNGVVSYNVNVTSTDHALYGEPEYSEPRTVSGLTYKFEDLNHYRTYNVVVTASTLGGSTVADPVSERTSPGPARSISGTVTVLPDNSARVMWEFPPNSSFPGPAKITIAATSPEHNPTPTVIEGPTYRDTGSPYTFTQLEAGLSYNITVTASTGVGDDTSFTVTDINTNETAPGKPASFVYDASTSVFRWEVPAVLDQNGVITGYVLSTNDGVPGFTLPMSFDAATFSYQLNNLPFFTKYEFALQAVNSAGRGVEFALEILTKEDVPAAITNITKGTITANEITISWAAQSPPVGQTTYDVVYTTGGVSTPVTSADSSITLRNLAPYTEYTISVTARTNAGSAAPYNVTIRTAEGVPGAVQDLALSFVEATYEISVSWSAPATPNGIITGYDVTWTPGTGSPEKTSESLGADATSHRIANVVASETSYTVIVTASTSVGAGDASEKTLVTPKIVPDQPTGLQLIEVTDNSATITATEPANKDFVTVINYLVKTVQTDCVAKGDDTCLDIEDPTNTLPFTKTDLMNYRDYTIMVAAVSAGGAGPYSDPLAISTLAGTPGTPVIHSIIPVPGGFDVFLNSSRPYRGPANYTATATRDGQTVTETVYSGDLIDLIKVELRGLDGDETYDVTGKAENGQGSSADTAAASTDSSPGQPTADVAASAEGAFTITITRITSATSYFVSYVEAGCTTCNATTVEITPEESGDTTYQISNLDAYKNYSVSVYAKSSAGDGMPTTQIQRTQAGTPTLVNTNASLPNPSSDTAGIQPAYAVKLTDLCADKANIFDETTGPVVKIAYFVQQQQQPSTGTAESVSDATFNVFYNDVAGQSPKPTYLSYTSNCVASAARRKRRQAVNNDVTIGSESSCPSGSSQCNGQLDPSTTYRFVACGLNENDRYKCLKPTSEHRTAPAPVVNGLSAGEIAAIVICSILLLILIILIIVYCVKRRRSRQGKASISKKGSDNPNFEEMGGQQHRYKVDRAAEPTTEYTGSNPQA